MTNSSLPEQDSNRQTDSSQEASNSGSDKVGPQSDERGGDTPRGANGETAEPQPQSATASGTVAEEPGADQQLDSTASQSSPPPAPAGSSNVESVTPTDEQAGYGAAEQSSAPASPSSTSPNQLSESPAQNVGSAASGAAPEETATGRPGPGQPSRPAPGRGPLSLERIRQLRKSQEAAQKATRRAKPSKAKKQRKEAARPAASAGEAAAPRDAAAELVAQQQSTPQPTEQGHRAIEVTRPVVETAIIKTPPPQRSGSAKVPVPPKRGPLPDELEQELNAALQGEDLDSLLIGDDLLQLGQTPQEGQRLRAEVIKIDDESVFFSLGGPYEGSAPITQFEKLPAIGEQLDVVVRGYLAADGIYDLTIPGATVDVEDWSDLEEGAVVEATVTGSNSGGLECTVGRIRAFVPLSQIAEYRVENPAEFIGQKIVCVVTEANQRRGNLVLSRRAVLEREREAKRQELLAGLQPGRTVEGVVRKVMDFGAFVDLGGVDGLLHVSELAWERVEHPSQVLEEGQKIKVKIEKVDPQTGKISLSYRSLQAHPWEGVEQRFPVGSIQKGTVTRIAEFGAFVRLAVGVEGLVHISELAHHRVSKVSSVVKEGQEVDVKVLSVDQENQRISLSMKAVAAATAATSDEEKTEEESEPEPTRARKKPQVPLKGGLDRPSGGEKFGLKW